MKILTVIGARPQFIKAACVSRSIRETDDLSEVIVHTGQHFDDNMSAVFFSELDIPTPKHNLGISSGSHGQMTGRMLEGIEKVILAENPDWVLVFGDTNSTLAGALAAAKLHVPVAHVEAGLRSFNKRMPEEINRILTDSVSSLLLTPTDLATDNLRKEGISSDIVVQVGDVMYDAALYFGAKALKLGRGPHSFGLTEGSYLLATIHRQENTDDPARLAMIAGALAAVAKDMPVLLPLHPRTRKHLERHGLYGQLVGVQVVEPLGYLDMAGLQKGAAVIATDSGGVQKEAFFQRVPCVTLRDETEWMELIQAGWNQLAPPTTDAENLAQVILSARGRAGKNISPYGNGTTADAIVSTMRGGLTGTK